MSWLDRMRQQAEAAMLAQQEQEEPLTPPEFCCLVDAGRMDEAAIDSLFGELAELEIKNVLLHGAGEVSKIWLAEKLAAADIQVTGLRMPLGQVPDPKDMLDKLEEINAHDLVVFTEEEYSDAESYPDLGRRLGELGAALRESNLYLVYQHGLQELARFDDGTGLELIFGEATLDHLSIFLDPFLLMEAGCDPGAWIETFSGFAPYVLARDRTLLDGKPAAVAPGAGNMNWQRIIRCASSSDVEFILIDPVLSGSVRQQALYLREASPSTER